MSLQGKTVVVIGGSSGIGLTTAKALVDAGAHVIISSRSEERLEEAKNAIGGEVEAYSLDVTREEDLKRFAKRTGHEIVKFEKREDSMRFLIKKSK